MSDDFYPPENYYRVSLKALIFDDQHRMLVCADADGTWSMPGGGWEHSEDYKKCIEREVVEELGARVTEVGKLAFFYKGRTINGRPKLCLAFPVTIHDYNFKIDPADDEVVEIRFATKEEFLELPFQKGEEPIQEYADQIWPSTKQVEKNSKNR